MGGGGVLRRHHLLKCPHTPKHDWTHTYTHTHRLLLSGPSELANDLLVHTV